MAEPIKISRTFRAAIKMAAEQLSETRKKITLEGVYNGHYVVLNEPTEDEIKEVSTSLNFEEMGISKPGNFWLVIENLMGDEDNL